MTPYLGGPEEGLVSWLQRDDPRAESPPVKPREGSPWQRDVSTWANVVVGAGAAILTALAYVAYLRGG